MLQKFVPLSSSDVNWRSVLLRCASFNRYSSTMSIQKRNYKWTKLKNSKIMNETNLRCAQYLSPLRSWTPLLFWTNYFDVLHFSFADDLQHATVKLWIREQELKGLNCIMSCIIIKFVPFFSSDVKGFAIWRSAFLRCASFNRRSSWMST